MDKGRQEKSTHNCKCNWLQFRWTDLEGYSDTFSIIE